MARGLRLDFFTEVPGGGDIYILKAILHDWSDEQCVAILRNCRRAMASDARLLVIEDVVASGTEAVYTKTLDVLMMGLVLGRERTEAESWRCWPKPDRGCAGDPDEGTPVDHRNGRSVRPPAA